MSFDAIVIGTGQELIPTILGELEASAETGSSDECGKFFDWNFGRQADRQTNVRTELFSAVQRYGFAVASFAVALGAALLANRYQFRGVEFPAFLFAIALTVWHAGPGPGVATLVLSSFAFNYFFTEPYYTLFIARSDLPYYLIYILFAALLTWFSSVRRRVERELEKKTSDLEAVNKELEAFAYSVSHDLRAPLRHMVGYTELLQKKISSLLDEKGRHYIGTILESAKRMGTLIDDLLAFSRISRAEARESTVSLDHLVKEVVGELEHETKARKIAWKISALPELYGDRSMIRLAFVNLVSNAVKFTRTRPRPEIEIGCAANQNDGAVVFVKDNGVGFDMKYANKLFGVFQRLHSSEAFEGTGIGLATVQRIIRRHGGDVWAESDVDKGATFYFSVPLNRGKTS